MGQDDLYRQALGNAINMLGHISIIIRTGHETGHQLPSHFQIDRLIEECRAAFNEGKAPARLPNRAEHGRRLLNEQPNQETNDAMIAWLFESVGWLMECELSQIEETSTDRLFRIQSVGQETAESGDD